MIIAQISDTHLALDTPDADQRIRDFALTVADLNALDPSPDVIVHTGDIVHNGRRDEYAQAAATLAKARAPVYVVAGNKDDRANLSAAFAACGYLAPDSDFIDYAIDDYPVRLIVLDTLATLPWEVGRGKLAQLLKGSQAKDMSMAGYKNNRNSGQRPFPGEMHPTDDEDR